MQTGGLEEGFLTGSVDLSGRPVDSLQEVHKLRCYKKGMTSVQ